MYAVSVSMQKRYETHLTQAAKTTRDALGATHEKGTTRKTPLHGNATAGARRNQSGELWAGGSLHYF